MKIEAIRTYLLEHRLDTAFESASMRFDRRQHLLVEVICDNGQSGWGECLGPARANRAVAETYANWLVGMDPLETEKIWVVLYNALRDQGQRGLTVTALSGIDVALWDIKGKHFGVPVTAGSKSVEIDLENLPEDVSQLVSLLENENVELKYWHRIAV